MATDNRTTETEVLRALVYSRIDEFRALLEKYRASHPRLFGSVARGSADAGSDIDILVDMDPDDGNLLMRASGLMEEVRELYDSDAIDIFPVGLLKEPVRKQAISEAVTL